MEAHVFDRATFHGATVARHGLPPSQAWVHIGLLFGWATERGLVATWLRERTPEAFLAFDNREQTGPQLLKVWDANLLDDMFTDEGLAFVARYFRGGDGMPSYFEDYRATLCEGLPSDYHVADTWENYDRIRTVIDERHRAFRETFDPSAPRIDLRRSEPPSELILPTTLPSLVLPEGIPLPRTTLGIVAARPETQEALARAEQHDGWLVLRVAGIGTGVAGKVRTQIASGDAQHALLELLLRVRELEGGAGRFEAVPEPEWTPACEGWSGEIRTRVGDIVRQRRARGEPPGALGLALALSGTALVDAVAGDLLVQRTDRRAVLEAPKAEDRVRIVLEALRKARDS